MKYLVGGALVFSQLTLSGPVVPVNSKPIGGTWTLKQIYVFNTMDGSTATITAERYDATGGSVDINISGNILGGHVRAAPKNYVSPGNSLTMYRRYLTAAR